MRNIKIISFDFDGTLCEDTKEGFKRYFKNFLKENYYLEEISIEEVEALKKKISEDEYEKLKKDKRKEWLGKLTISEETKNILRNLKEKYILVIFSSASREFVKGVLKRSQIDLNWFKKIYISREDFNSERGKEPWMFEKIAEKENLDPSECLHIGDSLNRDYYNPRKAGFKSYLIEHIKIERVSLKELENL